MALINLLCNYPKSKRNVDAREAAKEQERAVALKFGKEYFDGERTQGYGGYRYDGRWQAVAKTFIQHWDLKPGDRVLDIGCAKGFLVKDLMLMCPGLDVQGVDISSYAIENCEPEVKDRVKVANAIDLPFPDGSFKAAIAINSLHNLEPDLCKAAIKEMLRVSPHAGYIQVDAYFDEAEKEKFMKWQLTCKTHFYPAGWEELFKDVGYTHDYYWTLV